MGAGRAAAEAARGPIAGECLHNAAGDTKCRLPAASVSTRIGTCQVGAPALPSPHPPAQHRRCITAHAAAQPLASHRPFRWQRALAPPAAGPATPSSDRLSGGQRQQRREEAQAPGRRRLRLAAARRARLQRRCHGGVGLAAAGRVGQRASRPERHQGQGSQHHAGQSCGERWRSGTAACPLLPWPRCLPNSLTMTLVPASALKTCKVSRRITLSISQVATSKEVRQLIVSADGEVAPADADGQHVEGPRQPLDTEDAYGFAIEPTPEQAAILQRCRAKQERQRQRLQQYLRGSTGAAGGGSASSELAADHQLLKKLCRKVGSMGEVQLVRLACTSCYVSVKSTLAALQAKMMVGGQALCRAYRQSCGRPCGCSCAAPTRSGGSTSWRITRMRQSRARSRSLRTR